jgi:hypothetical protein
MRGATIGRSGSVGVIVVLAALFGCTQQVQRGKLASFSHFGHSAAIANDTAAIGAYQEDGANPGDTAGAVYVYTQAGFVWNIEQRLAAPDSTAGDQFGTSVALSDGGNTLAVGAPFANHQNGVVYVYERSNGVWTLQREIFAPSVQAGQAFGYAVGLDHDRLVVGAAQRDQGSVVAAGAAYVYDRAGAIWGAPTALPTPSPGPDEAFGAAVAVAGNTVVVSAALKHVGAAHDVGEAWVYTLNAGGWTLTEPLLALDGQAGDKFGTALAVSVQGSTRTLVVGAAAADVASGPVDPGAAYVFTSTGGSFTQTQKLTANDPTAFGLFGYSVAIWRQRVVVGAPQASVDGAQQGAAYVFDASSGSQTAELTAATGNVDDNFGESVAVFGAYALVGATNEAVEPDLTATGAVHAFREAAPSWVASHVLTASDGAPNDDFGTAIAVSRDTLVAATKSTVDVLRRDADGWSLTQKVRPNLAEGATITAVAVDTDPLAVPLDRFALFVREPDVAPVGYVEVYFRSPSGLWVRESVLYPVPSGNRENADDAVLALQGRRLVVGTPRYNDGSGRVSVFKRTGATWTPQQQPLESPVGGLDRVFGRSVALYGDTVAVSEVPVIQSNEAATPIPTVNGHVYLYSFDSDDILSPTIMQTLSAPDMPSITTADNFGDGLALGVNTLGVNTLAVAAEYVGAAPGRMVRVYQAANGQPTNGMFTPFDTDPTFSVAQPSGLTHLPVALDGDRLAVALPVDTNLGTPGTGEVLVYERQQDNSWSLGPTWLPTLVPNQGAGHDIGFVAGHLVTNDEPTADQNGVTPTGTVFATDL